MPSTWRSFVAARPSTGPLGIMSSWLPESFFFLSGAGVVLHVVCMIALRYNIDAETPLFEQLFTHPFLGGLTDTPWHLRGRYFLPWVASPEDLTEYWILPRALFWGARLGAMILAIGAISFFLSAFYFAGHDA